MVSFAFISFPFPFNIRSRTYTQQTLNLKETRKGQNATKSWLKNDNFLLLSLILSFFYAHEKKFQYDAVLG